MNIISKSVLYYKLTHPGPAVARKNDATEPDIVRIDWEFTDTNHSYNIKSYKYQNFYMTDIMVSCCIVTQFTGERAKKLFNLAQSVVLKKIASITTTIYPKAR